MPTPNISRVFHKLMAFRKASLEKISEWARIKRLTGVVLQAYSQDAVPHPVVG